METMVSNGGASTLPEAAGEPAADPEVRPQRRRARWPIAVYLLSGLLVVGAAVLVSSANAARSSATEAREHAEALASQHADAQDAARSAEARSDELLGQVRTVERAVRVAYMASDRYIRSRDEFVAAANAAIDLDNSGDYDGAHARFEGEVSDLLADLEPLLVAVQSGDDELEAAVRRLHRLADDLKGANDD